MTVKPIIDHIRNSLTKIMAGLNEGLLYTAKFINALLLV